MCNAIVSFDQLTQIRKYNLFSYNSKYRSEVIGRMQLQGLFIRDSGSYVEPILTQ